MSVEAQDFWLKFVQLTGHAVNEIKILLLINQLQWT